MSRTVNFEGATHQFPDDATDAEVSSALESAHPAPVDMSEKNYGTPKPEGQGFLAHASKTLRDLPDAFTSGRMISAPIESLGKSMQDYISSPTLHNSIRAIPGVGMMEDAIAQPYRTGASGDTAGAWGDAVDLAGQAALGLHGRIPEPIQEIGAAPTRGSRAILPTIPQGAIDASHLMPGSGPLRLGARAINAAGKLMNRPEIKPTSMDLAFPPEPRRAYDTSLPSGMYSQILSHDVTPMPSAGTMGRGAQSGFGQSPQMQPPPVEVGGAHIPNITHPQYGPDGFPLPGPSEISDRLSALPETSGPTAPRPEGKSRFIPGQYDAPKLRSRPVETGGGHIPDYKHPLPGPDEVMARISGSSAAVPADLLDGIARGQSGKRFSALSPEDQAVVRRIAGGVVSPAEQSLPGGSAVIRNASPAIAEPADMSDILQRSINHVRASERPSVSIPPPQSGTPLRVRRR